MEIQEQKITLRKLIASEGKVLRLKEITKDQDGKEIPGQLAKIVYLAVNESADDYEEIDEVKE